MGKKSTKEDKNIYFRYREEAGLTRAQASAATEFLSESQIEKIEYEKTTIHPEDVLALSKAYKRPSLCNHYCSQECPIGQKYVPQVSFKDLSQIILELLASLNSMEKKKDRLIEIAADGQIEPDELEDFAKIGKNLQRISLALDSLELWSNRMIAEGKIDGESLNKIKEELK